MARINISREKGLEWDFTVEEFFGFVFIMMITIGVIAWLVGPVIK